MNLSIVFSQNPVKVPYQLFVPIDTTVTLPSIDATASYFGSFQGAVTPTSALLSIKFGSATQSARVFYSKNSDLSNHRNTELFQTDSNGWVKIPLTSLEKNTVYYWSAVNDNKRSSIVCSFKTFADSYSTFKIAASSCAQNNSNHPVFTSIKNEAPLLFQHMGDIHYADISTNDVNLFRLQYENILSLANQKNLYQNVPLFYMWNDHDYGSNNSSASSPSRTAARSAYRSFVPSPPLASPTSGAIYYSYSVGNILFVVTDNRSERSDPSVADNLSKTVLGTEQKTWFKSLLLSAKNNNYRGIVWVNSFPWLGSAFSDDEWAFYSTERTELSNYIKQNQIPLLAIISGDAHMIAVDNGSANEIFGVPTYQFGALDQTANVKGAGYSHGTFGNGGQYGVLNFTNSTNYLQLTGTGKNSTGTIISRHTTFATKWIAYNDCYAVSTGTGFPRVTNNSYAGVSATSLIDYKTGLTLPVTIFCSRLGNTGVNTGLSLTVPLQHLKDLHDRFTKIISTTYVSHSVNAGGSFTIAIDGLSSSAFYLIEAGSDRGDSAMGGERGVSFTISGHSEIENLSSSGTVIVSANTTVYATGYNSVNGYIGRWVAKPTGTTLTLTSRYDSVYYPTGALGHPAKFFSIAELL